MFCWILSQTIRAWSKTTCRPRQLFRIPQFRVAVVNVDILNTSRRAPKPLQDKEDRLRRWRERAWRAAETARKERLTKRWEGDRAGCSTLTAPGMNLYKPLVVFDVHIYTTNMQYIVHSCYAAYATPTTTQVTHAHPTMHYICLVTRNQPQGLLYAATAVLIMRAGRVAWWWWWLADRTLVASARASGVVSC